ncbi:replication terminator protein, partial [Bacillus thuringiensis]|uniref:replication terminator protein n=1 Tax=Bacillus thuringiensis TaxID=1428 RepID=UPI00285299D7
MNRFADGAVFERVNSELKKVLESIADPTADPREVMKINSTIAGAGDQQRDVLKCKVQDRTTLVPATEVESKDVMDYDNENNLVEQELVSGGIGQTFY